jgi:hypothetical protein
LYIDMWLVGDCAFYPNLGRQPPYASISPNQQFGMAAFLARSRVSFSVLSCLQHEGELRVAMTRLNIGLSHLLCRLLPQFRQTATLRKHIAQPTIRDGCISGHSQQSLNWGKRRSRPLTELLNYYKLDKKRERERERERE